MTARALLALAAALEAGAAAAARVLRAEAQKGEDGPAGDEVVPLDTCGLERAAARRLVETGELPARKVGRRWMVRRADVAALILAAPPPKPKPTEAPTGYLDVVAQAGRKGRRDAA